MKAGAQKSKVPRCFKVAGWGMPVDCTFRWGFAFPACLFYSQLLLLIKDTPWAPFSWVTTGSHASRTVARRLLWCVPDPKMLWINPLASALCRDAQDSCHGFYCPAGLRLLQQNWYIPACNFPQGNCFQVLEGTSFSSASTGQTSETCGGVPCLPCCLQCLLRNTAAHGQGPAAPQRCLHLSSRLPVLGTELGLQTLSLQSLLIPFLMGMAALQSWR